MMARLCGNATASTRAVQAETKQTPLDYSDPSKGTFAQRYWVDQSHWAGGNAPFFVSVGGEGPCGPPGGWALELAAKHGAIVASVEHRFYGESLPAGGPAEALSVANLQYLTVANALEDLNEAMDHIAAQYKVPAAAPRVIIGGSYPGGLVGWHRVAFPNRTAFGLASSGVVNPVLEYTAFDEAVAQAVDSQCADVLRATTRAFEAAEANPSERQAARALFGSPPDMSAPDFAYMLADSAAMAVQYGGKEALCTAMKPSSDDAVLRQQFADFTNSRWGTAFGSNCFYDTECLKGDPEHWQPTSRSWRWQKCTEVAWLQTAPATGSLRSSVLTLQALLKQCADVFGAGNANPQVDAIRAAYGGDHPNTTYVFYSQGSDDPWRPAGVTRSISATLQEDTAVCDGCGHCRDLHTPSDADPSVLVKQRQMEADLLEQALQAA